MTVSVHRAEDGGVESPGKSLRNQGMTILRWRGKIRSFRASTSDFGLASRKVNPRGSSAARSRAFSTLPGSRAAAPAAFVKASRTCWYVSFGMPSKRSWLDVGHGLTAPTCRNTDRAVSQSVRTRSCRSIAPLMMIQVAFAHAASTSPRRRPGPDRHSTLKSELNLLRYLVKGGRLPIRRRVRRSGREDRPRLPCQKFLEMLKRFNALDGTARAHVGRSGNFVMYRIARLGFSTGRHQQPDPPLKRRQTSLTYGCQAKGRSST